MTCTWNECFILANFLQTPISTSNLTESPESQWNVDSNDVLSVRKYCQLFTHESNTLLFNKYVPSLPLMHADPHSIDQYIGPPHSPRQTTAQSVHTLPNCLESVLWQNGWVDLDAVWYGEWVSRGMGVLDGGGDHWRERGSFVGEFRGVHCNQWGFCCVVVR